MNTGIINTKFRGVVTSEGGKEKGAINEGHSVDFKAIVDTLILLFISEYLLHR